jgi:hypothetical protein
VIVCCFEGASWRRCAMVYGGDFCAACIIDYVTKWRAAELALMHTTIPPIDT